MEKKDLVESFKLAAREIGPCHDFWPRMIEKIYQGDIKGIDLRTHHREAKDPETIVKIMHREIFPGQEMNEELRLFYRSLLAKILKALDFRLYERQ